MILHDKSLLLLDLMFASNTQPSSYLTSLLGSYLAGWCEYSGYGMAIDGK